MFFGKNLFLFFKNNFTRINHCTFIHHKSHLKPFLSYLSSIVRREYFSIIFNVKKCTLYLIKYGIYTSDYIVQFCSQLQYAWAQFCSNCFSSRFQKMWILIDVEWLIEYQQAARMPALQCFILDLKKRMKLAQNFGQMQNILFCILRRNVLYVMF